MSIKVGDYVKHKKQNIEGTVVHIREGTVDLSNGENFSTIYCVKVPNPRTTFTLVLLITTVIISVIGIILQVVLK